MEWNVINLVTLEETKCYTLKEVFEIVNNEREVTVIDTNGKRVHFLYGRKVDEN